MTLLAGCGEGIDGTWVSNSGTVPGGSRTTLSLESDGTLALTIQGISSPEVIGDCTGTASVRGMRWSTFASELRFEGTAACEGAVTCTDESGASSVTDCHALGFDLETGSCGYYFETSPSSGIRFLTFTPCSGGLLAIQHQSFRRP